MDKTKIKDYITTVALAAVPVIVAYQAQIGAYVPVEYALLFTIAMGTLSQLMANKRVQEAVVEVNDVVDKGQAEAQIYLDRIAELQKEIDAKQAEVDKVAGLKELDNAPLE